MSDKEAINIEETMDASQGGGMEATAEDFDIMTEVSTDNLGSTRTHETRDFLEWGLYRKWGLGWHGNHGENGYARILAVLMSYYVAETNWKASFFFYVVAFAGDVVDGYVARAFNQSSRFGAVLDMVTDRCSTAGLLLVLSRLYKDNSTYTFLFLLLMFIDIFSHWMHVQSTAGRPHKAADTLADRNIITRLFYGCYPFFAFCCIGTELLYVSLYLLVFIPEAALELGPGLAITLHAFCYWVCLPACVCKQMVNLAQLWSASVSLASLESEEDPRPASTNSPKSD